MLASLRSCILGVKRGSHFWPDPSLVGNVTRDTPGWPTAPAGDWAYGRQHHFVPDELAGPLHDERQRHFHG